MELRRAGKRTISGGASDRQTHGRESQVGRSAVRIIVVVVSDGVMIDNHTSARGIVGLMQPKGP